VPDPAADCASIAWLGALLGLSGCGHPVAWTLGWAHACPSFAGRNRTGRSVSPVELDGKRDGPGDAGQGLPGCGAATAGVGHALGDHGQGVGVFAPGKVHAEAVVNAPNVCIAGGSSRVMSGRSGS